MTRSQAAPKSTSGLTMRFSLSRAVRFVKRELGLDHELEPKPFTVSHGRLASTPIRSAVLKRTFEVGAAFSALSYHSIFFLHIIAYRRS